MYRGAAVAAMVLTMSSSAADAKRIPVIACQQQVNGDAELVADLDCSGISDVSAVSINGRLFLNGFTITGAQQGAAVGCDHRCKIIGPGTITGPFYGVFQASQRRGGVQLTDVTVIGNAAFGVVTPYKARLKHCTVTNNGGIIVDGQAVGGGVWAIDKVVLRDSAVTGNTQFGVWTNAGIKLGDSVVQGNGTAPGCTFSCGNNCTGRCGDLATFVKPKLRGASTCDVSVQLPTAGTWGVCTND